MTIKPLKYIHIARMHYSGMCTAPLLTISQHAVHRGVSAQGGVCPGGCLPEGCLPRGCLHRGCLWEGVYPSIQWGRHPPPGDRQTPVKTTFTNFVIHIIKKILYYLICETSSIRDGSQIPRRMRYLPSGGHQHTNLPDYPKKLHKIKNILVGGVGASPLGSAAVNTLQFNDKL